MPPTYRCEGKGLTLATLREPASFQLVRESAAEGEEQAAGDDLHDVDFLKVHVRMGGTLLRTKMVAASKGTLASVGAYSRVRKQFKVPLAELEGVQEHLARIGGETYIVTAGQQLTNAMLNMHEQPPVITAILKQQATDRMRRVINDGMDVAGGSGICKGPSNYLAPAYQLVPIGITVEGANTLTRTLIQYGQGLMRSHPHLLDLVRSIQAGNDMKGFNSHLASLIGQKIGKRGPGLCPLPLCADAANAKRGELPGASQAGIPG